MNQQYSLLHLNAEKFKLKHIVTNTVIELKNIIIILLFLYFFEFSAKKIVWFLSNQDDKLCMYVYTSAISIENKKLKMQILTYSRRRVHSKYIVVRKNAKILNIYHRITRCLWWNYLVEKSRNAVIEITWPYEYYIENVRTKMSHLRFTVFCRCVHGTLLSSKKKSFKKFVFPCRTPKKYENIHRYSLAP